MTIAIVLGVLLLVLVACLAFWLKKVWTVMHERKQMVELAAQQRSIFRSLSLEEKTVPVQERSEAIYQQAVDLYMKAYNEPTNHVVAIVLGFHPIEREEGTGLRRVQKRC